MSRAERRPDDSVEAIVPVCVPASDGNDPDRYAATVRQPVSGWRAGH